MATKTRYPNIPRIGKSGRDIAALIEVAEILNGARGKDNLDRALTLRDFLSGNAGAGIINDALVGIGDGSYTPPTIIPDQPTQPTGFTASGGFNFIILQWDPAIFVGYAFTRIYRATTDDFGLAVQIATNIGPIFGDDVNPGESYYYWIRFTNTVGDEGPLNDTAGTFAETGIDPAYLIAQLSEQITENEFVQALNDRIDLIDVTGSGGLVSGLAQEVIDRGLGDATLVSDLSQEVIDRTAAVSGLSGDLLQEAIDRATGDSNLAGDVTQEAADRLAADNLLNAGLSQELIDRATQDSAISSDLLAEVLARSTADGNLQVQIDTVAAGQTVEIFIQATQPVDADAAGGTLLEGSIWYDSNDSNRPYRYLSGVWVDTSDQRIVDNAAAITAEVIARTSAVDAEAARIDSLITQTLVTDGNVALNTAGLLTEESARTTAIDAEALRIDALEASTVTLGDDIVSNTASIVAEETARSNAIDAEAARITTLEGTVISIGDDVIVNAASISSEETARVNAVAAEAVRISALETSTATFGNDIAQNTASIQVEEAARVAAISAEAVRTTALEAEVITLDNGVSSNFAAIQTEATTRSNAVSAEAARIDVLVAQNIVSDGRITTNEAAIVTEATTRATDIGAEATRIDTLQVTVGDIETDSGLNTAAVQTLTNVVIGPTSLSASYTLKFDVNGYVSGYTSYNDGTTSAIVFNVDTFAVGKLGTSGVLPFFVTGGNVYLDSAVIKNTSISSAQIISLVAESITGFDASYVEATLGDAWITNLMIGNFIQSNNYSVNGPGWQLQKDYGLTLRGPGGAIILQSRIDGGTALGAEIDNTQQNYADVTGGPPSTADNTAANTGAMAHIDQITRVNISTYIQSLAVDTLQIAGQAVTFPHSAISTSATSFNDTYTTITTMTITSPTGAPIKLDCGVVVADSSGVTSNWTARMQRQIGTGSWATISGYDGGGTDVFVVNGSVFFGAFVPVYDVVTKFNFVFPPHIDSLTSTSIRRYRVQLRDVGNRGAYTNVKTTITGLELKK